MLGEIGHQTLRMVMAVGTAQEVQDQVESHLWAVVRVATVLVMTFPEFPLIMLVAVAVQLGAEVVVREVRAEMGEVEQVHQGLARVELRILVVAEAEAKEQTATIFRAHPAAPAS